MKKPITIVLSFLILGVGLSFLSAQEQKSQADKELIKSPSEPVIFNPAGRRDPFKNLLGGKDIKDKSARDGIPDVNIDDLILVGIVKSRQALTAIISGPQGFPFFIKVGDKFSDGYVLSINEYQVVFRKTNERGFPLMRPKDIIKEINPEER